MKSTKKREKALPLLSSDVKVPISPFTVTGGNKAGDDLVYDTTLPALLCKSMRLLYKSCCS